MKVLTFYLLRNYLKEKYTIGNLYSIGIDLEGKKTRMIENQFLCNILEDKFRGNDLSKKKVYGETCIPEGTYEIKLVYSSHFKRKLPELQNVPFFTNILMHAGNEPKNSLGCLLPGENKEVGKVLNSRMYEDIIVEKIKQYDLVRITIKNNN